MSDKTWGHISADEKRALVCELIGSYEAREGLRGKAACSCLPHILARCAYCQLVELLELEPYRPPLAIHLASVED